MKRAAVILAASFAPACDAGESAPVVVDDPLVDLREAAAKYPTLFEVQRDVVGKTCGPNPGVCHSGREYPDLHALEGFVAAVDAPCNVLPPTPEEAWDACEPRADRLHLGDFVTEIAWTDRVGPGEWAVTTRDAVPADAGADLEVHDVDDALVFAPLERWEVEVARNGERQVLVRLSGDLGDIRAMDAIFESIRGGDVNRNGIFGAEAIESAARLVVAGDLARSYLWQRVAGDVPGTRMPLANGPMTNPQLVALGCAIDTLVPGADVVPGAPIDYAACARRGNVMSFLSADPAAPHPAD